MKIQIICLLILFPVLLNAQRHDYNWYIGYPPNDETNFYGGSHIWFDNEEIHDEFYYCYADMTTGLTMSDQYGDIVFYSNGCRIWNRNHMYMENGDTISDGVWDQNPSAWSIYCPNWAYPSWEGPISVQMPGSDSKYAVVYARTYLNAAPLGAAFDLLYSVVDMNGDDGLGEVTMKDMPLIWHEAILPAVTAVRHGNGRDWWFVTSSFDQKKYFTTLLSPTGFGETREQLMTESNYARSAGQIAFSPDGTWYCESFGLTRARLMRFDRCSGEFYNSMFLQFPDSLRACGVSFSPNSKVLYMSRRDKIFQFDLSAPDIEASRQVVAEYDGFVSPFPTTFFQGVLAPDNKIYLTSTNGVNKLHVIDYPDSIGVSCGVRQHGYDIPTYHGFSVPNFPHYRLYDEQGSVCDTLGIDGPVGVVTPEGRGVSRHISCKVIPNPSQGAHRLEFSTPISGIWSIESMQGVLVASGRMMAQSAMTVDISGQPSGMYVFRLISDQGNLNLYKNLYHIR